MVSAFYPDQVHKVYHVIKGRGLGAIKKLVKNCEDQGIQILRQTRAKKILTSATGDVIGVLAETGGKALNIISKSIIMTTGGYGGNKEMVKKYYPSYTDELRYFGTPAVTGDGIRMVTEVGADTEDLGQLLIHGPHFLHAPWLPSVFLSYVALEPYNLWVNKTGERFVDEGTPLALIETANALDRQPGKVSYHLFDERIKQKMLRDGIKQDGGEFFKEFFPLDEISSDLDQHLQAQVDKGLVKISDSLEDLAEWMGVAPGALKATIDEYNQACGEGYDALFIKDPKHLMPLETPPYYAIQCGQAFLDTSGGIKVNHHMEVLNPQDNPIPGLYAAGVSAGGWESNTYCIILSGSAFSFALNSGRIAGENAAQYISK